MRGIERKGNGENVPATAPTLHAYLNQFAEIQTGRDLPWLRELRDEALSHFQERGFPTAHDEDWRFTSVAGIAQTPFRLAPRGVPVPELAGWWTFPGACWRLVFVNGRFAAELSRAEGLPAPVKAGSLAAQLAEDPESVKAHLGRYLDIRRDVFSALNTAFAEDGACLRIPRNCVVQGPIHLLFISAGGEQPVMSHPRNLIVAEENSQAAIIEDFVSLNGGSHFCNAATELIAGENASVSHYRIEREAGRLSNISTLRIQMGRNAAVAAHSILLGGALVRQNMHPVLAGEGADCLINGLYIGRQEQHLDNYMLVEHRRPHCASRQFYNGILDERAHGVFHGRIVVHKDAQKTDAKQTNRNLLLSDEAQIDTKPQLEIYADDVKCTHGATIGQIDEDALFYLRSRGIAEADASRLLLLAFARESLERMKEEAIRGHIEGLVAGVLNELSITPGGGRGTALADSGGERRAHERSSQTSAS